MMCHLLLMADADLTDSLTPFTSSSGAVVSLIVKDDQLVTRIVRHSTRNKDSPDCG